MGIVGIVGIVGILGIVGIVGISLCFPHHPHLFRHGMARHRIGRDRQEKHDVRDGPWGALCISVYSLKRGRSQ